MADAMVEMKTTVVCGLLGSGKTTFIEGLLRGRGGRAVVLVNDFGEAGIDGEIISAGGLEAVELPSGCVCCELRMDLMRTIREVREKFAPAHLVIEPSGVASPSGVLEALASVGVESVTVVGIVDATEFAELYEADMYGSFLKEQVELSDLLLINKSDLATGGQAGATRRILEALNPGAIIQETVMARLPAGDDDLPAGRQGRPTGTARHSLPMETVSARLAGVVSREAAMGLFRELSAGSLGGAVRAKALLRTDRGPFRLDLSFGTLKEAALEKPVAESRLVVIGTGLRREDILRRARSLTAAP
ncbi:MAG: hypothetical protein Kow0025_20700 [Thermodesulfovibrionales bacterium]